MMQKSEICVEQKGFFPDILFVLKRWELWVFLAWFDIKLKYKRTKLGPLWMVIVSFVSTILVSFLGSMLFKVPLKEFFPYVACGMVTWSYLSSIISESATVFMAQSGLIKNVNVFIISFVLRLFVRSTITFLHAIAIVLLAFVLFGIDLRFSTLLLLPFSLLITFVAFTGISTVCAFFCSRFRDLVPLIGSLLNILAFMTPIMWKTEMLGARQYLANLNPITHFIAIFRDPMLGQMPSLTNILVCLACCVISTLFASIVYNKYVNRVVYWL